MGMRYISSCKRSISNTVNTKTGKMKSLSGMWLASANIMAFLAIGFWVWRF